MKKPMSVEREEFINSLCTVINDSDLPMFIIEYIMRDVYSQVKTASEMQCRTEIDNYRKTLAGEVVNSTPVHTDNSRTTIIKPAELEE